MIHVAGLTFYWLWHPLSGIGYQFWSGIGSDFGQLTLITGLAAVYWQHTCHVGRCWRFGRHLTADGQHKLCRKHHPDLPNHRLSLAEIHERHHNALAGGSGPDASNVG